jgi:hypothetical protein
VGHPWGYPQNNLKKLFILLRRGYGGQGRGLRSRGKLGMKEECCPRKRDQISRKKEESAERTGAERGLHQGNKVHKGDFEKRIYRSKLRVRRFGGRAPGISG